MKPSDILTGEYNHQLDEKNRIRIPAKLKDKLGENPFLMKGPNNSILVLKADDASKMLDEYFNNIDAMDPEFSDSLSMLTSSAVFAEEDKQGRIMIPNKLLEHALIKVGDEINHSIITVGAYNKLEIYRQDIWESKSDISGEEFNKRVKHMLNYKNSKAKTDTNA